MIDNLPPELVENVFRKLLPDDLINCALVSKGLFSIAARILPQLANLKIALTGCPTRAGFDRTSERSGWLRVCGCEEHGVEHVFRNLVPVMTEVASSLEIEDELVKDQITDEQMGMLLAFCGDAPLKRLSLSKCDLMKVQPWTLALLARFDQLEKLEIEGCTFSVSESMLIRSLSTSFQTLTDVDLRDNRQITDKFSLTISKSCPLLEHFRISNCPLVSTFSVLSLIESTFYRVKHALTVYMDGTPFSADQLYKYMNSPLFSASADWRLTPAYVQLGFEKPAVLAEHRRQRCVLVYV